jgi:hypothetical protein
MGTISITEARYVLLVLRQAKLSSREGAIALLDDLKTEFETSRGRCAADARSTVGHAIRRLQDSLDESWPTEEQWREAFDLTSQWRAALK